MPGIASRHTGNLIGTLGAGTAAEIWRFYYGHPACGWFQESLFADRADEQPDATDRFPGIPQDATRSFSILI
jgi:hypothetical protein